jgi:hypothetical protein
MDNPPANRSKEIKKWKDAARAKGHDMGNVVNCSPFISPGITVATTCRKCGAKMYVIYNQETNSWGAEGTNALFVQCPQS